MKIPWRDATRQTPAQGMAVVALSWHWKNKFPASMEIMGGYVQWGDMHYGDTRQPWRLETDDDSGKGAYAWDREDIDAWCYAEEFRAVLPDWIKPEGE